jgi:cathepsin B
MLRTACIALLVASVAAHQVPSDDALINDLEHIASLNTHNSTWVAGVNERFANMTYAEARALMGTSLSHISEHLESTLDESHYSTLVADSDIPASFNAVDTWKGLVKPIRDQQRCGSCWAFSAAEVLSDRLAIATKDATKPVLSPEDLVSCDKTDMGCQGGQLPAAWKYLTSTGIVSDKCFPYGAGSGTAPSCPSKCQDGETWASSKVKAASSYAINGNTNMQKEIMTKGPIQVAFKVYKSFMSYKSGVYKKHWYEFLPEGGHAVKIVGWGTESGTDYWLVANSWNTSWGLDGYFKIARGDNQCGIEKMGPPYAGMPAV